MIDKTQYRNVMGGFHPPGRKPRGGRKMLVERARSGSRMRISKMVKCLRILLLIGILGVQMKDLKDSSTASFQPLGIEGNIAFKCGVMKCDFEQFQIKNSNWKIACLTWENCNFGRKNDLKKLKIRNLKFKYLLLLEKEQKVKKLNRLTKSGRRDILKLSTVQYRGLQYRGVQYIGVLYSTVISVTGNLGNDIKRRQLKILIMTGRSHQWEKICVQYTAVQYRGTQHSTVHWCIVKYSLEQYSEKDTILDKILILGRRDEVRGTEQYSTVYCGTVQYSTVQYTVQYSTEQYRRERGSLDERLIYGRRVESRLITLKKKYMNFCEIKSVKICERKNVKVKNGGLIQWVRDKLKFTLKIKVTDNADYGKVGKLIL